MNRYRQFDKLTIQFDTGPQPPPFCHRYEIALERVENVLKVALNLEYYDRDEISEEDILDEGFTMEDDVAWQGNLPDIWNDQLEKKLGTSNWKKKEPDDGGFSTFSIRYTGNGVSEILYPADRRSWEIFGQDIIQAVFELSGKEASLEILYSTVYAPGKSSDLRITYRFAHRKVEVISTKGKSKIILWSEGQKLMQYIFYFDFLQEDALDTIPDKPGNYLNPGDGWWYTYDQRGEESDIGIRWQKLVTTLKGLMH